MWWSQTVVKWKKRGKGKGKKIVMRCRDRLMSGRDRERQYISSGGCGSKDRDMWWWWSLVHGGN